MMNSMLGLILLEGLEALSVDAMSASPDPDGSYGPLDELLAEVGRSHKKKLGQAKPTQLRRNVRSSSRFDDLFDLGHPERGHRHSSDVPERRCFDGQGRRCLVVGGFNNRHQVVLTQRPVDAVKFATHALNQVFEGLSSLG